MTAIDLIADMLPNEVPFRYRLAGDILGKLIRIYPIDSCQMLAGRALKLADALIARLAADMSLDTSEDDVPAEPPVN